MACCAPPCTHAGFVVVTRSGAATASILRLAIARTGRRSRRPGFGDTPYPQTATLARDAAEPPADPTEADPVRRKALHACLTRPRPCPSPILSPILSLGLSLGPFLGLFLGPFLGPPLDVSPGVSPDVSPGAGW